MKNTKTPQEELPERLRTIAEYVDEWNFPLCARVDLLESAKEIERLHQLESEINKKDFQNPK